MRDAGLVRVTNVGGAGTGAGGVAAASSPVRRGLESSAGQPSLVVVMMSWSEALQAVIRVRGGKVYDLVAVACSCVGRMYILTRQISGVCKKWWLVLEELKWK